MIEHPTKSELDDYRSRVLAPGDFLSVHRHVTTCARCAAECDLPDDLARDLNDLHAAFVGAPEDTPYHLSAAEAAAYARGTLNEIDLEIAESHLSVCETCLTEVQRHAPAEVKTFKSRGLPFMNVWRIAAVVACGIIVILFAIWLLRSKPAARQEQVWNPANTSSPQSSPAAEVQPSPDAEPALVLNDGNRKVTVDQQGTLAGLERLPLPIQQKVRAALQAGRVEPSPALAQLASAPSTLLGQSDNGLPFRLVGPVGEVVRTTQPTFRWHALAGAQSYTVNVTDADLNEVATSPPLNTTEWRISKPLKEGGIYSWQVTALKDGVKITSPVLPAPQAKFKVIDRSTAEMLQQARRVYPDSHLTLAVLYAEAGLVDEAEQELRAVVRDNPRAGIAQRLLRQVQAMR